MTRSPFFLRPGPTHRSALCLALVVSVVCGLVVPVVASGATAAPAKAKKKSTYKPGPRRGGTVQRAWPATSRGKPKRKLARFLALQVGPGKPLPKKKKTRAQTRGSVSVPSQGSTSTSMALPSQSGGRPLALVRSYAIPRDDPSYTRLLNLSFTYDSAIAAIALVQAGNQSQAKQLLDQLSALQHRDGSLAFAYNTQTGAETPLYRTGAIAWVGLAAVTYEQKYGGSDYEPLMAGVASWLAAQQDSRTGLLRGGPDVSWISTQQNIVTYFFLRDLSDLDARTDAVAGHQAEFGEMANDIGDAIKKDLLVDRFTGNEHLAQGLDDPTLALDVQGLGSLFFAACGCNGDAQAVLFYGLSRFTIGPVSIVKSSDPRTYNMTYESRGPFFGYRPYVAAGAPDVLWAEGTNLMLFALQRFGYRNDPLTASMQRWTDVTGAEDGILGANQTVESAYGDYHVWPTSAATSWGLLVDLNDPDFLAAS